MRTPLAYILHSGNLYGTERMALATCEAVADEFACTLFAPPGPALDEAKRMGFDAVPFRSKAGLWTALRPWFARNDKLVVVTTGVAQALVAMSLDLYFRREIVMVNVAHGGTNPLQSFGRRQRLNRTSTRIVAVSPWVREQLIAWKTDPERIAVVSNFLSPSQVAAIPRRQAFMEDARATGGLKRVCVVSRLDPIKRVDLLFDLFERHPDLHELDVQMLGGHGERLEELRRRARDMRLPIRFHGYVHDVPRRMAQADFFVHLCPEEPFGLTILEAMYCGLPVVVPDAGGAASIVRPGATGLRFAADDVDDLARCIDELRALEPSALDLMVAAAREDLGRRFSAASQGALYRFLFNGGAMERLPQVEMGVAAAA